MLVGCVFFNGYSTAIAYFLFLASLASLNVTPQVHFLMGCVKNLYALFFIFSAVASRCIYFKPVKISVHSVRAMAIEHRSFYNSKELFFEVVK